MGMLPENTVSEIRRFLEQVVRMDSALFGEVYRASVDSFPTRDATRHLATLSAADSSWLDKRVADTIRPLLRDREWPSLAVKSSVASLVRGTSRAIVRRDRLTSEQYDAWMGGFRRVGVRVPPHPSEVDGGGS